MLIFSTIVAFWGIGITGYVGLRELMASFFMLLGFIYKRSDLHIESYPTFVVPFCALIVAIGAVYWNSDMLSVEYYNLIPYSFAAIAGSFMVLSICHLLLRCKKVENALSYIGIRTLDILTFHFLSFKLVSLFIIYYNGLSIHQLGEFPIMKEYSRDGWWLLYTVIGVLMPLMIENSFTSFKKLWKYKEQK